MNYMDTKSSSRIRITLKFWKRNTLSLSLPIYCDLLSRDHFVTYWKIISLADSVCRSRCRWVRLLKVWSSRGVQSRATRRACCHCRCPQSRNDHAYARRRYAQSSPNRSFSRNLSSGIYQRLINISAIDWRQRQRRRWWSNRAEILTSKLYQIVLTRVKY